MVKAAVALACAMLLDSCASGPADMPRLEQGAGAVGRLDPAQTALEREVSEDVGAGDPGKSPSGARLAARITVEGSEGGADTRNGEYLAIDEGALRCRLRRREGGGYAAASWYGRLRIRSGLVDIHAGSFTPDIDGGLAAGGARSPYVFSSGFPLEEPRRIHANTSLYGRSLVGGAVEGKIGVVQSTVFAGRERVEESGRPHVTGRRWGGGRVEGMLGSLRAGLWALGGSEEPRFPVLGAGVRSSAGGGTFRTEAVWRRGSAPGTLAAASLRAYSTRFGAVAYSLPSGSGGPFARIAGNDLPASSAHAGAAASVERKLPGRAAARLSVEWRGRSGDDEDKTRIRVRAEVEKRWRGAGFEIGCAIADERRSTLMPYPAQEGETRKKMLSMGGVFSFSALRGVAGRIAVRNLAESPGEDGFLVTAVARFTALSRRIRIALFHSSYRGSSGAPPCPVYEPSPSGLYPWRYLAPGGHRNGAYIINKIKWIEVSCKVASEGRGQVEWSGQALCAF